MANVLFQSAGTLSVQSTSGSDLTLDMPDTITPGWVLVALVGSSVSTAWGTLALPGFTRRNTYNTGTTAPGGACYSRVADGTEGASILAASPGGTSEGIILAFSSVDTTTPFDVADLIDPHSTAAATYTLASQTPTLDGAMALVHAIGNTNTGTYTGPTGYTADVNNASPTPKTLVAHKSGITVASGTGTRTVTLTSVRGVLAGFVLRPAASKTPVSITRSTTWDTLAGVSVSRSTSWDALASVSRTRSTTWDVLTPVSVSRSTTWDTLAGVARARSTTWDTLAPVSRTRATTWDVLTGVSVARSTTWDALAQVSRTRSTSWDTLAGVSTNRSTTWNVAGLAGVSTTRSTSWDTLAAVSRSRATSWDVAASVALTRGTTWNVLAGVSTTRATSWDTRSLVETARETTWGVLAAVSVARSTSWAVLRGHMRAAAERLGVVSSEARIVAAPAEDRHPAVSSENRTTPA